MSKHKKTKQNHSTNRINSKIKIENKNLSVEELQLKYKDKILKEKECCKKDIVRDIVGCSLLLALDSTFFFCFFGNKLDLTVIGAILAFMGISYVTWNLLKTIPGRIQNYKNFNLEKSCYATIENKQNKEYKDLYGNVNTYCIFDLKLDDTKNLIKKHVSYDKYTNLKVGGKVIVASFDNYNTYLIEI